MWATSISLLGEVERRALPVEETRDAPAAQEAHGLELLDRGVHRVEAVGMQFEGADRADAGDEEQEAPGQVALALLVLAAGLGFAEAAVVLADHGLAPAEEADRAPARLVDRHRGMAHAVAHPAIGRVLRPVVLFVRAPGRQLVRHHGLPVVGGEHHREAVQAPAFAPILAIGVQNLPGDLGIGKVLRPHGEPRHVARHQRRLEVGQGFGDGTLDLLERLARGHALGRRWPWPWALRRPSW
jgi:hypothetical protein